MNLKEWRLNKGWSQKRLADEVGYVVGQEYRQSHVSGWENGTMPDALVGEAIAQLTGGQVKARSFIKHQPEEKDKTDG